MKLNKYSWLAALPMIFTACQNDTLVENQQQNDGFYSLNCTIGQEAADSRAQIILGNTEVEQEFFKWNAGDAFTLYLNNNKKLKPVTFTISSDYSNDALSSSANFFANEAIPMGTYRAVYPTTVTVNADEEYERVALEQQKNLDFSSGTVEEVWRDYFSKNMLMRATVVLTEGGAESVNFQHECALARITYKNESGKDQPIGGVSLGGNQQFGHIKTLNVIGGWDSGASSNDYPIFIKNLTVKDGDTFDFYVLFFPCGFADGEMHLNMNTSGNWMSPLTLPLSTIAAANNGSTSFVGGKRYWFNVTQKPEGLAWTKDVNVGNMGLLAVISKVYPDLVTKNSDGTYTVNQDKAAEVVELALSGQGTFESLDGIENFPNLERLFCDNVGLKTLDVSKNQKLKQVEVGGNLLTSLSFSNNPALEIIKCHDQQDRMLASLDVKGNINLRVLECQNNTLASLDLSNNTNLEEIDCGVNKLSTLNVANNLKLRKLFLACNNLTSLNISMLQSLKDLHCTENHISELDITKNEKLGWLNCGNQQPDGTEITVRMTEAQKVLWDTDWSKIEYWNSRYVNVVVVEADSDLITIQNAELSTALQAVLGAENVKLENGYAVMTKEFAESVETIEIPSGEYTITSLNGIEYFINLKRLSCPRTGLTECNLSKNTKLESVAVWDNSLTTLDLGNQASLFDINCAQNNTLQTLKINENARLKYLIIDDTNLQSLAISHPETVWQLACSRTPLNLNLTQFTGMQILYCSGNKLTTINLTTEQKKQLINLECDSNSLTSLNLSEYPNLRDLSCWRNLIETLDITPLGNLQSLRCGNQQSGIVLQLKLTDEQKTQWESKWKNEKLNTNVELSTAPSVEPGNGNTGGSDFTIEGIY